MKKYKHKPTGSIVEKSSINGKWYSEFGGVISEYYIKGDDWEEVKQPIYEILSYKYDNRIFTYDNTESLGKNIRNYLDKNNSIIQSYDMHLLKIPPEIHSVKRLSDNKVFTISDDLKLAYGFHKIQSIKLINDQIVFYCHKQASCTGWSATCNCTVLIQNAQKPNSKIYTTEDGVDIFDQEDYEKLWGVALQASGNDVIRQGTRMGLGESSTPPMNRKWFWDKKKAQEYLLYNRPCLSINDIATIYITANSKNDKYKQPQKLLKLVKSKLNL